MPEYRLAHYLALCGVASRKNASQLITQKRVLINDELANHTHKVDTSALPQLKVDGQFVPPMEAKQYWIYHKPVGIDCNLNPEKPSSLIHHLPQTGRIFPVGRLDKDSRGLLLLTNDGDFLQQLMHPQHHYPKTYLVEVDKPITEQFVATMANGVRYKDVLTRPCEVSAVSDKHFQIRLTQGMNRQIRRMAKALGFRVVDLCRCAIGDLSFSDVTEGQMRPLSHQEYIALLPTIQPITE
ncbi:pseudouridine synthase [Shewanella maritima]|uniref:pseudouridine synthase n=1 Tax=Shewanella maritima TaxID=2520507 RepID=UPI003735D407